MLFLIAIALGVGIVVYALWRVPTWLGVLHAAAGVVVYAVVGYACVLALLFSPRLLEPLVASLRGVHLDRVVALFLTFAPPLAAGLLTVRMLGRDRMSR